ncbi:MAG: hypothetical protein HY423_13615 [Candidatus Lambdaproteobacteria bacterium]|nr:hypothetical protein [Candidatus Lambdaproteobacteria bacterium]
MRISKTYTFIVARNFGHPLTLSLSAWRVHGLLVVGGLALAAMAALSALYLIRFPHWQRMERERRQLERERDALMEQIAAANQDAYDEKLNPVAHATLPAEAQAAGAELAARAGDDDRYSPPVRIYQVITRIDPRSVTVAFRMVGQIDDARNRGGYLFAIFENQEQAPPAYVPTPSVRVNGEGFPQAYKLGIRFPRLRGATTYQRSIRRDSAEETFTHVTLYLFSLRGGLLLKERFEMDKAAFSKPGPVVQTHREASA